jgi:hypothetical protein
MQNKSINHMNQPQFNHPIDPLAAEFCFWETLSRIAGTSQSPATVPEVINSTSSQSDEQQPDKAIPGISESPTTVPEIMESTPTQSDEQRPDEEPRKTIMLQLPICQDSQLGNRRQTGHTIPSFISEDARL